MEFHPEPCRGLRVTIEDPTGMLAQGGFITGDVVVGRDGRSFEEGVTLSQLLDRMTSSYSQTFTVARGSETLEVRLNDFVFFDAEDAGGFLEPVPGRPGPR